MPSATHHKLQISLFALAINHEFFLGKHWRRLPIADSLGGFLKTNWVKVSLDNLAMEIYMMLGTFWMEI
jgi:hypothetical protein